MCKEYDGGGIIRYEDFTGVFVMPTNGIDTQIIYCPWCGRKLEERREEEDV